MDIHRKPEAKSHLVKLFLELPKGSPFGSESLWAERVSEGKYSLRNSPFYAYGYSFCDVVSATEKDGLLHAQKPIVRSGHSTYRVFLAEEVKKESPEFASAWRPLEKLGCSYEGAGKRLLSIDVPPSTDILRVYRLLEEGEKAGIWEFEEGHCGHPGNGS